MDEEFYENQPFHPLWNILHSGGFKAGTLAVFMAGSEQRKICPVHEPEVLAAIARKKG